MAESEVEQRGGEEQSARRGEDHLVERGSTGRGSCCLREKGHLSVVLLVNVGEMRVINSYPQSTLHQTMSR